MDASTTVARPSTGVVSADDPVVVNDDEDMLESSYDATPTAQRNGEVSNVALYHEHTGLMSAPIVFEEAQCNIFGVSSQEA